MVKAITDQFNVIVLGIVFDPLNKKILIGKRNDSPYFSELGWTFPGGKLKNGNDPDKTLKERIKNQTGHKVKNLGAIFAKTYPEQEDLIAVYFLCESVGGNEKTGKKLIEMKWISPEEVENHFTTSFHPRLKEYILSLK